MVVYLRTALERLLVCLILLLALFVVSPAFAGDEASASVSQAGSATLPDSPGATKFAAEQSSSSADESSSKSNPLPDADSQLVTYPPSDKIQWKPDANPDAGVYGFPARLARGL